jgi:hypothetical protein
LGWGALRAAIKPLSKFGSKPLISMMRAAAIAATGVDLMAIGAITHSAPILDIGLDHQAGVG